MQVSRRRDARRIARRRRRRNGDAICLRRRRAAGAAVAGRLRLEIGERCGAARPPRRLRFAGCAGSRSSRRTPTRGRSRSRTTRSPRRRRARGALRRATRCTCARSTTTSCSTATSSGAARSVTTIPSTSRKIFLRLGMTEEQIDERFGFFLEALRFGAPPHGGMALGIDRIAMIACGESAIRDVIAFPKNQVARDVMMDAPSPVPDRAARPEPRPARETLSAGELAGAREDRVEHRFRSARRCSCSGDSDGMWPAARPCDRRARRGTRRRGRRPAYPRTQSLAARVLGRLR